MSDTTWYISSSISIVREAELNDPNILGWISAFLHQQQYWLTDEEEQYLVSYVRLSLENANEH
jgi:hypothetical protein